MADLLLGRSDSGSFRQRWRYWKGVHGGIVVIPAILAFLYPEGDPDA